MDLHFTPNLFLLKTFLKFLSFNFFLIHANYEHNKILHKVTNNTDSVLFLITALTCSSALKQNDWIILVCFLALFFLSLCFVAFLLVVFQNPLAFTAGVLSGHLVKYLFSLISFLSVTLCFGNSIHTPLDGSTTLKMWPITWRAFHCAWLPVNRLDFLWIMCNSVKMVHKTGRMIHVRKPQSEK